MSLHPVVESAPNHALIRERCSYPVPAVPKAARRADVRYEWKFEDTFGNRFGRFFHRLIAESEEAEWVDVFQRSMHLSGFLEGKEFALATIFENDRFAICLVRPPEEPKVIFQSNGRLELRGLSADEEHFLVDAAQDGNWFRPEVLVLDIEGGIRARMGEYRGVRGCWAGGWAPDAGDPRVIVHHEATGFVAPVIWFPFEDRLEEVSPRLEGEARAKWDRTGRALLLHRTLNGRSDLHRMDLQSKVVEQLQPLDGVVYHPEVDEENQAVGRWASNQMHLRRFLERERFDNEGFEPSVPLAPLKFRRIAGVPCLVAEPVDAASAPWTIFEGYGDYSFHYSDTYWAKVQVLVDHGFRVVLVNTRGCNGFGREWREGTAGNIGFTELEDLQSVRAALVAEGLVDPRRAIVYGESWGGYMALLAMGTQPELWRMAVASVPVGDWRTIDKECSPFVWHIRPYQFGGTPETAPEVYRLVSPITYAERITGPILMISGKHDTLCPPQQNERFAEAVRMAGGQCEHYIYDGAHGPPSNEEYIGRLDMTVAFLLGHCQEMDGR